MGKLSEKLDADLKQAMLSGDKVLVSTLRGIKSSLQYAQVEKGVGENLSDDEALKVLQKESKKRADAAELYLKGGDSERADNEKNEKKVIDAYLPAMMTEEETAKLVDEAIAGGIEPQPQNMGRIISEVIKKAGGLADGGTVARLVKERLNP